MSTQQHTALANKIEIELNLIFHSEIPLFILSGKNLTFLLIYKYTYTCTNVHRENSHLQQQNQQRASSSLPSDYSGR